jgi:three-Cys-motif partner protein
LMSPAHVFGGSWTATKLKILKSYLQAYSRIFAKNEKAKFFDTFYVDAFAGSGYIQTGDRSLISERELFTGFEETESQEFLKGSSVCALEVDPPFKNYLFIERSPDRCIELEKLRKQFPTKASLIQVQQGDANEKLLSWVHSRDWYKTRAVVFLDPYGMQVDWETLKALGATRGVDLWLLFPLGAGVMRLLKKSAPPPKAWQESITRMLGTTDWESEFYRTSAQTEFGLGFDEIKSRDVDQLGVSEYLLRRVGEVFYRVHPHPFLLKNSKNNPLYLFCFACGSEKGATPAMKIVEHLMKIQDGRKIVN